MNNLREGRSNISEGYVCEGGLATLIKTLCHKAKVMRHQCFLFQENISFH